MNRIASIAANTFREVEAFSGRLSPLPKSRSDSEGPLVFQGVCA
jgi:hypothetical protein